MAKLGFKELGIAFNAGVLSPFQKDALRELANIGSGHAVTSLSEMLGGKLVHVNVPRVELLRLEDAKKTMRGDKIAAGIFFKLRGEISGYMQILFPERSALTLVDVLMGKAVGETQNINSELERSALNEVGNILASAFCDALSEFLGVSVVPSPPSFAFDFVGAIVESAILAVATDRIILFECDFSEEENDIHGYILLFPSLDGLRKMLALLEAKINGV